MSTHFQAHEEGCDVRVGRTMPRIVRYIKAYLTMPLILASPIKGKPLVLFITSLNHSLGALLAQENAEANENTLSYLSLTLVGLEEYTLMSRRYS